MSGVQLLQESEDNILVSKEPKVTSDDPGERKEARRLRIKRRQEAIKKQEQHVEEVLPEDVTLAEQISADAVAEMQRLSLEAAAKVINVKVTADEREVQRRQAVEDAHDAFLLKLEEDDLEASQRYQELSENWEPMLKLDDPLEIDAKIKEQKVRCNELLDVKNSIIEHLKADLANMDKTYAEDLEKQGTDIGELSDRIEKQITIIQRANEKQLVLIEQALEADRAEAIEYNQKRWEALFKQRDKEELLHMDRRFKQLDAFIIEMDTIMWENIDKYRETKIELETLLQELQKELEKVLKKREEENIMVRSQQKRTLNRLTDVTNSLRDKIEKAKRRQKSEQNKSKKEIARLREDMELLQNKSHHFSIVNDRKWREVWLMNRHRCEQLYDDVCFAEKVLHEQILVGEPPKPPMKPKQIKLVPQIEDPSEKKTLTMKPQLVSHLLTLIGDNTGFLVEERLHILLKNQVRAGQNLCRIDAIFNALEVTREEDVNMLCEVMQKHACCPICDATSVATMKKEVKSEDRREWDVNTSLKHFGRKGATLTGDEEALKRNAEEIVNICKQNVGFCNSEAVKILQPTQDNAEKVNLEEKEAVHSAHKCAAGHDLEIDPTLVLASLSEFVAQFVSEEKEKYNELMESLQPPSVSTFSRTMSKSEMSKYWGQYAQLYTPAKAKFWEHLTDGLQNYYETLLARSTLYDEVAGLRIEHASLLQLIDKTVSLKSTHSS